MRLSALFYERLVDATLSKRVPQYLHGFMYRCCFELLYLAGDPWDYETSSYERQKYERVLACMQHDRPRRVLEAGCSIGVFTKLLATRVELLEALDFSSLAITRAKRRCRDHNNIVFHRTSFFHFKPRESFDLIICSEILYYFWEPAPLRVQMRHNLVEWLTNRGKLIVVWGGGRLGLDFDAFLTETSLLRCIASHYHSHCQQHYRISVFEKQ